MYTLYGLIHCTQYYYIKKCFREGWVGQNPVVHKCIDGLKRGLEFYFNWFYYLQLLAGTFRYSGIAKMYRFQSRISQRQRINRRTIASLHQNNMVPRAVRGKELYRMFFQYITLQTAYTPICTPRAKNEFSKRLNDIIPIEPGFKIS